MTNPIRRLTLGSVLRCDIPPLSRQTDGFQLLIDLRSPKQFIDPELIREIESRMLEYTRIEPPIQIRVARDNVLLGTAKVIKLVVVRGTDNILRTFKLPIVPVPGTSWAE